MQQTNTNFKDTGGQNDHWSSHIAVSALYFAQHIILSTLTKMFISSAFTCQLFNEKWVTLVKNVNAL